MRSSDEEPDPQRQHVVLVEGRLEKRVVRAAVDVAMKALIEVDQGSLVACRDVELGEKCVGLGSLGVGRSLRGESRCVALQRRPYFGESREVADVDGRDEHSPPRVHVDQAFAGERAKRLAHGRSSDPQLAPSAPVR